MILLELFIGFLKVGCFAFGGAYGAIPLIRDVVLSYGWLDDEMLTYMIAVSESTPGPIMVNLATYVGSSQAGILGSIVSTLAVVLPSFIIILLVTVLLKTVLKNKYVQAVLLLIDPWFQDQGTGFSVKAVKPEMQGIKCPMNALPDTPDSILREVDYCLVTHLHFDHFGPDYLTRNLRIIAQNNEDAEKICQMGFENTTAFESACILLLIQFTAQK